MARDERNADYLDELDASIDDLIAGRAPRARPRDMGEARLLLLARRLRALGSDPAPAPAFVRLLGERIEGLDRRRGAGRRKLLGGLAAGVAAAAAAFAGGVGAERARDLRWRSKALVGEAGAWYRVVALSDLPPGRARFFVAGALQGYLVNDGSAIRARSAICTHMGCLLSWQDSPGRFACPCHGATFDPRGRSGDGRHPDLPEIRVKVEGGDVFAWGTPTSGAEANTDAGPAMGA